MRVLRERILLPPSASPSRRSVRRKRNPWQTSYSNPTRRQMATSRGKGTPSTKMTMATSLLIGVRPMTLELRQATTATNSPAGPKLKVPFPQRARRCVIGARGLV